MKLVELSKRVNEALNFSYKVDYKAIKNSTPYQIEELLLKYNEYDGIPNVTYNDLKSAINSKMDEDMHTMFNDPFLDVLRSGMFKNSEDFDEAKIKIFGSIECEDFLDDVRYKRYGIHNVKGIEKVVAKFNKAKFNKTDAAYEHINHLVEFMELYAGISDIMTELKGKIIKGKRVSEPKPNPKLEMNMKLFNEYTRTLKKVQPEIKDFDPKKSTATIQINGKTKKLKLKKGSYYNRKDKKEVFYYVIPDMIAVRIGNGLKIHGMNVAIIETENGIDFSASNYTQWRYSDITILDWFDDVPSKYKAFFKEI